MQIDKKFIPPHPQTKRSATVDPGNKLEQIYYMSIHPFPCKFIDTTDSQYFLQDRKLHSDEHYYKKRHTCRQIDYMHIEQSFLSGMMAMARQFFLDLLHHALLLMLMVFVSTSTAG